jgi:hypothetical protein
MPRYLVYWHRTDGEQGDVSFVTRADAEHFANILSASDSFDDVRMGEIEWLSGMFVVGAARPAGGRPSEIP